MGLVIGILIMRRFLARLVGDSRAATAVEYGLIISLIVLAMVGALAILGTASGSNWDSVSEAVTNA